MSAFLTHTCPLHPTLRPFVPGRVHAPRRPVTAAGNDNGAPIKQGIGEDVLAKLRAAEEEAAKLRKELAKAKADAAAKGGTVSSEQVQEIVEAVKSGRIDGGDMRRLSPFAGSSRDNWLAESDVSFLNRAGPSEAESSNGISDSEEEVVKRRVLIGIGVTIALGAFALVPTDSLRLSKPSRPLYLYLIPLLRIQALLTDVREIVAEGKWGELSGALQRIQGTPNNAEANLRDAAYSVEDARTREKAELLARDIIEYLDSIDYNKYYDAMGRPGNRGGNAEKQFSDFSVRAVDAAQSKIREFLALMPRDAVASAREQALVPS